MAEKYLPVKMTSSTAGSTSRTPSKGTVSTTTPLEVYELAATCVRYALLAAVVFTFAIYIVVSFETKDSLWKSWAPATCAPNNCFCEKARNDTLVKQPANSFTNVVPFLVGVVILTVLPLAGHAGLFTNTRFSMGRTSNTKSSSLGAPPCTPEFAVLTGLFGAASIVEGVGSFFYHQSLTLVGQWFDNFGMYLCLTALILYQFQRLNFFSWNLLFPIFVAVMTVFGVLLWFVPGTRRIDFALLIVSMILVVVVRWHYQAPIISYRWFFAALITFLVAFVAWELDLNLIWCNPTSLIQGHAVWHILTAVSMGLIYLFLWSEQVADELSL
eukprot:TRINITY_DN7267_c0_g1_i1.p1 TRINITY_DN7267_c0_g1~~TRINITY_DN7267_c0_g1_i1.p1  ORF type:complete len:328 (+),score=48.21 TRINITY_DN7267_c0_g1_i1:122-1105(+)